MIPKFSALPKGVKRLILIGYVVWFVYFAYTNTAFVNADMFYNWVILIFGYWVLVFCIIWIYEGFKTDK